MGPPTVDLPCKCRYGRGRRQSNVYGILYTRKHLDKQTINRLRDEIKGQSAYTVKRILIVKSHSSLPIFA